MGTRVLAWPAFKPETGNPYSALLAGALERHGASVDEFTPGRLIRGRYDVWHLHWPERVANRLLRVPVFFALVLLARTRRTRLVWTVHNLDGHFTRRPRVERRVMTWLSARLDGIVGLSGAGVGAARRLYPALETAPAVVVPHGHYIGRYPNEVSRVDARASLGLAVDDRVLAFVGRIREDKGVERLVREFRFVEDRRARLVVAGRPSSPELALALRTAAAGDERVVLHLREIADDELQVFLNSADVVALPYERILESGTALLALSFGRPVLVPDTLSMRDLRTQIGADAVRLFGETLELENALSGPRVDPASLIARVRERHDWDAIAERTLTLYAEASK
jgi:glycosyltransferase involved in cell wall biosynthesis